MEAARDFRTTMDEDELNERVDWWRARAYNDPVESDVPPTGRRGREGPALRERSVVAVAKLRNRFADLDTRLREAHGEIARLEGELARWRARYRAAQRIDVPWLRRQVAYYCHPDRGGDGNLMTSVNVVFDFLERLQQPSFEPGQSRYGI